MHLPARTSATAMPDRRRPVFMQTVPRHHIGPACPADSSNTTRMPLPRTPAPRQADKSTIGARLLLAAALALLSGLATARDTPAKFEMTTHWQRYATEIFGSASADTRLQVAGMRVLLRVTSGSIGGGVLTNVAARPTPRRGSVRYCLSDGATFARDLRDGGQAARDRNDGETIRRGSHEVERLRFGDFDYINHDHDGDNIDLQIESGGQAGDSCVELALLINSTRTFFGAYAIHTIETGDEIIFNVPAITNADPLATAGKRISVTTEYRNRHPHVLVRSTPYDVGTSHPPGVYRFGRDPAIGTIRSNHGHIAVSSPGLRLILGNGSDRLIDRGNPRRLDRAGLSGATAGYLRLGTLSMQELQGTQIYPGGGDIRLADPGSDQHRLVVTATGHFNADDQVFLDLNRNALADDNEIMAFNKDRTVAARRFPVRSPLGDIPVYYRPGGTANLLTAEYTVDARYDFAYSSFRDIDVNAVTTTTRKLANLTDLRLVQTIDTVTYATEVFGDASDTTNLSVPVTVTLAAQEGTGVGTGGSGLLRFELDDPVVFGRNVQESDLVYEKLGAAPSSGVHVAMASGSGAAGSSSVDFIIEVAEGQITEGDTFTFTIPAIRNTHVLATADTAIGITTSALNIQDSGNGNFTEDAIRATDTVIAVSDAGFIYDLTQGATAAIDPQQPTRFVGDDNIDTDGDATADAAALPLGRLTLRKNSGVQHDHDGGDLPIRNVDNLILSITGAPPNTNDRFFIDLDNDTQIDAGEVFDTSSGTPTLNFTDAASVTPVNNATVYYLPGGTDNLAPATYTLTTYYDFLRPDGEAENYRDLTLTSTATITDGTTDQTAPDDLRFTQTANTVTYAAEVFADASAAATLDADGMSVTLTVQEGSGVGTGGAGQLWFSLFDGVYGEAIEASDLVFTSANGRSQGVNITRSSMPGLNRAGGTLAAFDIEVNSGAIAAGDTFVLTVPAIRHIPAPVAADAKIRIVASTNLHAASSEGGNFRSSHAVPASEENRTVAVLANALAPSLGNGVSSTVDRADNTRFSGAANVDTSGDGNADTVAMLLGSVFIAADQDIYSGNTTIAPASTDRLTLAVDGTYNDGDRVFIDLDGDGNADRNEQLTIGGNTADGTFAGNDIGTRTDIYYLPGGAKLGAASFLVTATYDRPGHARYNSARNTLVRTQNRTTDIVFLDLVADGWASAVPDSNNPESVNVRIINEMPYPVTVYGEGRGDDGTYLGLVMLFDLAGNQTRILNAGEFEELFCGMVDPTCWKSRANFQFFRDASDNISVQSFHRGPGSNLRNLTFFTGLEVAEDKQLVR